MERYLNDRFDKFTTFALLDYIDLLKYKSMMI